METEIRNVSLSFCCKKDWNTFQSIDERNRFCSACQHNVVDFTKSTQAELDRALKNGERVCGRFTASQLSDRFLKYIASTAVAAASVLSAGCANTSELKPSNAVQPSPPEQIETTEEVEHFTMGVIYTPIDSLATDSSQVTTEQEISE